MRADAEAGAEPVRVVLFSTLYPSLARPGHAVFVETRLRHLVARGGVDARVVAPVPWFPRGMQRFPTWSSFALTPRSELRHGLQVVHPRYALPPAVGETFAPAMLALGTLPALRKLQREGFDFEMIDAHYYYPDGVAAALLGAWLGKPVTITARGSDLNVLGRHALPRSMMVWAARRAAASIAVCDALADTLAGWGVSRCALHVIRNGVDLDCFKPLDRAASRAALAIEASPVLLTVGNLVEVKGHELALEAFAVIIKSHPHAQLLLVGDGPLRGALVQQASALGVVERVRFVGAVPGESLAAWYSAADVLLLPSRNEGLANVLLESMACGTPVVAMDVGGCREVLGHAGAGQLVGKRDVHQFAHAIEKLLTHLPDRLAIRQHAARFSWAATADAQLRLMHAVTRAAPHLPRSSAASRS